MPDRRRNGEAFGQLCIDIDFCGTVKLFNEAALHALFCGAVGVDVILDGLGSVEGLLQRFAVLFRREDAAVVAALDLVVGNVLHDHGRLLFFDEAYRLADKFLGIVLEHSKGRGANPFQNRGNGAAGEHRVLGDFADQIIFDLADLRMAQRMRGGFYGAKRIASSHHIRVYGLALACLRNRILQLADEKVCIHRGNRMADEFIRIKLHRIGITMVDSPPERLKLLFIEALVERILGRFGLVAILKHFAENAIVKDCLHQLVDALRHGLQRLWQGRQRMRGKRLAIFRRDGVVFRNIIVL